MKKTIAYGLFVVVAAIITGIFGWITASRTHKVEIRTIKENTISKEEVNNRYIQKDEYESLKRSIDNKKLSLIQENKNYKNLSDSLKSELDYIKLKCDKISSIPGPSAKFEVDNMLFELEKAYQQGNNIVVNMRLTNLGNDKKYWLDKYKTVLQAPDGLEYAVKKIFKGGKKEYSMNYSFLNNEDILYIVHFGDVSSQLTYDKVTFKSVSSDKTQMIQEVAVTKE